MMVCYYGLIALLYDHNLNLNNPKYMSHIGSFLGLEMDILAPKWLNVCLFPFPFPCLAFLAYYRSTEVSNFLHTIGSLKAPIPCLE